MAKTRTTKSTSKKQKTTRRAAVTKRVTKVTSFSVLKRLHWVSVVTYLVVAVAAALLIGNASYVLGVNHLTKDTLLSQDTTVFVSAFRPVFDLEIRWAAVFLALFSLVFPLLYLTKLKNDYQTRVNNGRMLPWRWIDLGISGALMLELAAVLSGVQDLAVLKLMGGLIGVAALLGWLAEQHNNDAKKPEWKAFGISLFSGGLPWVMIGLSLFGTIFYGSVRSPWYVYATSSVLCLGFILIALNQRNQYRKVGKWESYPLVERNYAVISLVTKLTFLVILIVGLAK